MTSAVDAVVFLGLVAVALPSVASRWLGGGGLVPAVRTTGWVVAAVGLALSLTCIRLFVRLGDGTQSPRQPPKRPVVAGPYDVRDGWMDPGSGFPGGSIHGDARRGGRRSRSGVADDQLSHEPCFCMVRRGRCPAGPVSCHSTV